MTAICDRQQLRPRASLHHVAGDTAGQHIGRFTAKQQGSGAVWSFAALSETRHVLNLSARERQIVMHLGKGRTSKEIARMLEIFPRTVESYRARLLKKYNASNVAELLSHLSSMPG